MGKVFSIQMSFLAGMTLLLAMSVAMSAELRDVAVEVEDGHYSMRSEVWFEADRDALYRVLTNFDLFEKFTSAIVESYNVEPDEEGRPQFYARMEGCVVWFCKSFIRNGHVTTEPVIEIIAISDPEKSDFHYSRERWFLREQDEGTIMIYEFDMEPAFWVPPVVGPFFIKRALRESGADAVNRIEALAQSEADNNGDAGEKVVQSEGVQ